MFENHIQFSWILAIYFACMYPIPAITTVPTIKLTTIITLNSDDWLDDGFDDADGFFLDSSCLLVFDFLFRISVMVHQVSVWKKKNNNKSAMSNVFQKFVLSMITSLMVKTITFKYDYKFNG